MDGTIFNSRGVRVGMVLGPSIFDPRGQKLYDLKGTNVYKLSGELVGHLPLDVRSSERRLDKSADKLFRDDDCQALTAGFRACSIAVDLRLRFDGDGSGGQC